MDSIAETELKVAEACFIDNFVQLFSTSYEPKYTMMYMHQLLNLTDCVRATGPLFSNNCFIFEDLNGYILGHIEYIFLDKVLRPPVSGVIVPTH